MVTQERTEFDADGTKFRVKADGECGYSVRHVTHQSRCLGRQKYPCVRSGTRVKIVRKPCPEGQGLRTAVMEMASAVGWSEYQLNSRLGG